MTRAGQVPPPGHWPAVRISSVGSSEVAAARRADRACRRCDRVVVARRLVQLGGVGDLLCSRARRPGLSHHRGSTHLASGERGWRGRGRPDESPWPDPSVGSCVATALAWFGGTRLQGARGLETRPVGGPGWRLLAGELRPSRVLAGWRLVELPGSGWGPGSSHPGALANVQIRASIEGGQPADQDIRMFHVEHDEAAATSNSGTSSEGRAL